MALRRSRGARPRGWATTAAIAGCFLAGLWPHPVSAASVAAPGAPTGVGAVAGDGSATIRWTPPTSSGSTPIVAYRVTASPGGQSQQAPGTSTEAVVSGLTNGVAESFTVVAQNQGSTSPPSSPSNQVTPDHPGGQYHALIPYRICDTRTGDPSSLSGLDLTQCEGRALGPGDSLSIKVAGTAPSGASSGGVPAAGVSAVVINVTVTGTTASSYLTTWAAGAPRPTSSSLNWEAGQTVSNLVTVAVGAQRQVSFFNYRGSAELVVDVEGYLSASATSAAGRFTGLAPYRVCDTRSGNPSHLSGLDLTQCAGRALGPSGELAVQVAGTEPSGASSGGVPGSGVAAVLLNITATDTTATSYLTVWPTGSPRPKTSNLNWRAGETVSIQALVQVGAGGRVSLFNWGGAADVVVDVGGWFSDGGAAAAASYLTPASGGRICDTRPGNPSGLSGLALRQCEGHTLGGGATLTISATALAGVPGLGVQDPPVAVVLQVTVVDPSRASFLTIWPAGQARPTTSSLNWEGGQTVSNQVVAVLADGGRLSLFNAAGDAAIVVAVEGYFSGAVVNNPFPFTAASLIDPLNGLTGLSCASASFCVAVDLVGNAATWNGTTWTQPQPIDPNGAGLSGISCPSQTFCAAVDLAGAALTWNGQQWSAPVSIEPDNSFTGVSCTSASFCVAIDDDGNAVMWNGTGWSTPRSIGFPGIFLNAVSCASPQLCAVADLGGDVVFWTGSAWSLPQLADSLTGGILALSCPTTTYCVGVDGGGEETTWSHGSWSPPTPIEPNNALYAISCASPSFCVAGDGNGRVLTAQGGIWGPPLSIDPYGGGFLAISCPSPDFCAAADSDGYVLTGTSTGWSSPSAVDPNGGGLTAVSCSAPSQCIATDNAGNALSWNGSQWGAALRIDPSGGGITAISCASGPFCAAVDRNGQAATWAAGSWSKPQAIDPSGGGLTAISCTAATFCAATDSDGNVLTWDGSGWSQPQVIDPSGGGLTAISCPAATFCAATDGDGNLLTWDGSGWSQPQAIDPKGGGLTAISCASASFCAAVDAAGDALTWDGIRWTPQVADPGGDGLAAVSCVGATLCVAVDNDGNALTWDGAAWGQPEAIDPDGGGLAAVSCPSLEFCVTVDGLGNALT